jgi:hypothetical protein
MPLHPVDFVRLRKERRQVETVEQLSSEVAARVAVLVKETPSTHSGWSAGAVPLRDAQFGAQRPALLILSAAVGVLALIACANLAHLTLAQAAARRLERALRAALGDVRIDARVVAAAALLAGCVALAARLLPLARERGQDPGRHARQQHRRDLLAEHGAGSTLDARPSV